MKFIEFHDFHDSQMVFYDFHDCRGFGIEFIDFHVFINSKLEFYDFHDCESLARKYYDFHDFHYYHWNLCIDRHDFRHSHIGIV